MLIQFKFKNFKCFKDEVFFSMLASFDDTRQDENILKIPDFNLRLLKSAVIYGANASGKSTILEALTGMIDFVILSQQKYGENDRIPVEPFLLCNSTKNEPSEYEVIFYYEQAIYRYGFEANYKEILAEWFYYKPHTKEIEIFYREGQVFKRTHPSLFKKGKKLVKDDMIRNNALFLSASANFKEELAQNVLSWAKKNRFISGLEQQGYKGFSMARIEDDGNKQDVLELMSYADLGIEDLQLEYFDPENKPKDMPDRLFKLLKAKSKKETSTIFFSDTIAIHTVYDKNRNRKGIENFSMEDMESAGTRKFFALSGPILDSLQKGRTLLADELDSRLHPFLTRKIIELFLSKRNNTPAQLIFNTHDTNLLSSGLFRRDQIWFTEKNRYGEATVYSLNDFKEKPRKKDVNYEKQYVEGRYGAIPFLGNFEKLLSVTKRNKNGADK